MNILYSKRFSAAIVSENARGFAAVIPDIKCISPKEGDLLHGRDPVETAKILAECGASLMSVVTERKHFGGSKKLLRDIAKVVNIPILRKDFITTEDHLLETAELGAAAVLLICATVDEKTLELLYNKALSVGLEPLVEVHTEKEMELAYRLNARLVGINNRDITGLEKDEGGPERTQALISGAPSGSLAISESGITTPPQATAAVACGANAILVGTALWKAVCIKAAYRAFQVERSVPSC
jgi:indole-3-glycerol phosphate synthase